MVAAIQVRNHIYPGMKMEYYKDGQWINMEKTDYNHFLGTNMGTESLSVRITDIRGYVVTDTIQALPSNGTSEAYIVPGNVQFPDYAQPGNPPATGGATVPTGLTATAGSGLTATAGSGQAALAWNALADATSYTVKRAETSGGPYTTVDTTVTATTYTDTGLTNGTTYYYVVSASNSAGESLNSAQASATPQSDTTVPVPTGLTATAGSGQAVLAWNASADATSYTVKRAETSGGPYTTVDTTVTATTYTDTGLTNGTTYYYVVSATNSAGESLNSAQARRDASIGHNAAGQSGSAVPRRGLECGRQSDQAPFQHQEHRHSLR